MIENIRFSSFFKLKYFFRRNLNWIKFISSFRQLCDLDFNLFIYIYVIRMGENQTSGRFSSHFATSNDATHRQRQMQTEDSGVRRYVTQESSSSSTKSSSSSSSSSSSESSLSSSSSSSLTQLTQF